MPSQAMGTTEAGVIEEQFPVRSRPGESPEPTGHRGLPVAKALREYAGIEQFGYLTVPRPTGATAYIAGTAFSEPSSPAFEGGLLALFSYNEGSTRFVRPAYAGNPDDINAEDAIATVTGEPLVVGVHEGQVASVGASASTTSPDAGSPVQFTATASGGEPGEGFSFEWRFGDGATATGESVSHSFAGAGTYEVRVTAVGSDESGGESGPLSLTVGTPPAAGQPSATAPTSEPVAKPKGKKPAGRTGKGHGGRGGAGPHAGGGGDGNRDHGSHSKSLGGSQGKSGDSSPAAAEPVTTTPAAPEPTPVPRPLPAPEALPEESVTPPPAPSPPPDRVPKAATSPSPAAGELVEGRLVGDDLGPVSAAEAASSGKGSRSAAAAVDDGGFGVPVVALIVVALLAAGALFEWRRRPPIHR